MYNVTGRRMNTVGSLIDSHSDTVTLTDQNKQSTDAREIASSGGEVRFRSDTDSNRRRSTTFDEPFVNNP